MSMMPKTRVKPAASRNSINPSCSPFSSCSAIRERGKRDSLSLLGARHSSGAPSPTKLGRGAFGRDAAKTPGPRSGRRGHASHAGVHDPSAAVRRRHLPKRSLGRRRHWSAALPAMSLLHLALGGVDVLEIAEHLADRLVGDATARIPVDLAQIVVLDRKVVLVEAELAAGGVELRLAERLAQGLLVLDLAADLLHRGVDQQR